MKVKKLTQSDLGAMKRLLPFIGKRWIALLLSLVLAAGSVVLQLYVPILFGDAIDTIVSAGPVDYDAMWGYLRRVLVCAGAAGSVACCAASGRPGCGAWARASGRGPLRKASRASLPAAMYMDSSLK